MGRQVVDINVKGGYSRDHIVVKQDRSVRLNFKREETARCSEQVVFEDFGIARDLPAIQATVVKFTPEKTGEFTSTCGTKMHHARRMAQ